MIEANSVEWTQVMLALIGIVPGLVAAVLAYLIRRDVRTPSGDKLGEVAERTHDLSAANLGLTKQIHEKQRNGEG